MRHPLILMNGVSQDIKNHLHSLTGQRHPKRLLKARRTPTAWQFWAEKHKDQVDEEWKLRMRKKGWDPKDKVDAKKGFGMWNTVKKDLWEELPPATREKYLSKLRRWKSDDLSKKEQWE